MAKVKPYKEFGPFTWAGLSSLRTVSFLKIGYFGSIGIPVVAYVLRIWQAQGAAVPLPMTLFWMYLGSASLALGHLLNEIACPHLIKKFPTLHEYRAHLAESFKHQEMIFGFLKRNLQQEVIERLEADKHLDANDRQLLSEVMADALVEHQLAESAPSQEDRRPQSPDNEWTAQNESLVALRTFVVLLYGFSAIIVAWFSVRQFLIVYNATFSSITFPCLFP